MQYRIDVLENGEQVPICHPDTMAAGIIHNSLVVASYPLKTTPIEFAALQQDALTNSVDVSMLSISDTTMQTNTDNH